MPPQFFFGHATSVVRDDDGTTAKGFWEADGYVFGVCIPSIIDELLQGSFR